MRKTIWLLMFFCVLLASGIFLYSKQQRNVQFGIDEQGEIFVSVRCGGQEEAIYPWYSEAEGCYYFFLPSFVDDEKIYCDVIEGGSVLVDEQPLKKGGLFRWREGEQYEFVCAGVEWQVQFMRSANLPSIFLKTDNGDIAYLNEDKAHETSGEIIVADHIGNVQYAGRVARVSGRGESSWLMPKKSYNIRLEEAEALCGLSKGKRFCLLAMYREGTKMNSVIAYQLAEQLSMEYVTGVEWVDVWIDGRYAGLYLLAESVSVGEGRVEITDLDQNRSGQVDENGAYLSFEEDNLKGYLTDAPDDLSGGYLVEKEFSFRYGEGNVGFLLDSGNCFVVKEPDFASYDEVDYIRNCFERVEQSIINGNPDYAGLIDLDSFVERFLVEELTLNYDAGRTSTYFYKKQGDDRLYAGPVWDYDLTFGKRNSDYADSLLDQQLTEVLDWYDYLYEDDQFYQRMKEKYESVLPWFEWLLKEGIDEYAQCIRASERMDAVLWESNLPLIEREGIYLSFENDVRYLKYFIANRLNYLNERWGIDHEPFALMGNGEYHTVTFSIDGWVEEKMDVLDGTPIEELPTLNPELYDGWIFAHSGQKYDPAIPILEDTELTTDDGYRSERLRENRNVSEYLDILKNEIFSCCIYIPAESPVYRNEALIAMIEDMACDENLQCLQEARDSESSYFVIIDKALQNVWESVNDEPLGEISTAFGMVSYGKNEFGECALYMQGDGNDYLLYEETPDIVIIAINRRLGRIEDAKGFWMDESE